MKSLEIGKPKPAELAEKPAAERVDSVKPSTEPAEKPAAEPVDSVKPTGEPAETPAAEPVDSVKPTAEPAETPAAEPVDTVKPTAEPAAEVPETILEPDPEAMAANEGEPTMQEAATQVSTAPDVSTIGTTPVANAKANVTAGSLSLSAEVCGGDVEMKVAANAGDTSVEASVRKTAPGKPDALDDLEMHLERMVDEAEELEQANQRARALEGLLQALLQQPAEMHQARSTYIRNMLRRPGTCDIEELAKKPHKGEGSSHGDAGRCRRRDHPTQHQQVPQSGRSQTRRPRSQVRRPHRSQQVFVWRPPRSHQVPVWRPPSRQVPVWRP